MFVYAFDYTEDRQVTPIAAVERCTDPACPCADRDLVEDALDLQGES